MQRQRAIAIAAAEQQAREGQLVLAAGLLLLPAPCFSFLSAPEYRRPAIAGGWSGDDEMSRTAPLSGRAGSDPGR